MPSTFETIDNWDDKLNELGITGARHVQIATEGALIGSIIEHGFNRDIAILSDDAGQFNIFNHALCWIHAERTFCKLIGFSDENIQALDNTRSQIWELYAELNPTTIFSDLIVPTAFFSDARYRLCDFAFESI